MNAYIIKPDTIFKLSDDKDIINVEVLNGLITKHKSLITDRYQKDIRRLYWRLSDLTSKR
jgi:hypothetical protein